jgi:tRNA/tmRNA/rRNA uracil-C5-methylase (TrmA/RlmC/RlmD family)
MLLRTNYTHSLREKNTQWENSLAEISSEHQFSELIRTPITKGYRSRAKYKIFGNPDSFIIKATDPVQGEVPYEDALWMMPSWGKKLVIQIVEIISDRLMKFWVDGFEVQLAHGNRYAHVTLSVKRKERQSYEELAEFMLDKVSALEGVSIPSQKQDFGKPYLLHNINGKYFYSQYSAFFQSNLCLTSRLLDEVERKCQNLEFCRILDLYCGVGLFSLTLAKNTTKAIGVDIDKRAIDSARLNAKNLGLGQVSFLCCPVENFLHHASISSNDLVIIDPPRSGCPKSLIEIISEHKPHYIFSISCNPRTHIRDLKQWIGVGYTVRSIAALDMFPFTEYLETAAFLLRND